MKCGHCKETGVTVDHVKSHTMPQSPTATATIPSPRREADLKRPVEYGKGKTALPFPAGRYAILVRQGGPNDMSVQGTDEGVITKFYKVDVPTEGRWEGYVFVKVQASDDFYAVRDDAAQDVLRAIAKNPREAMVRYGKELGVCGACGRTLTDEESRAYGIGPVCRVRTNI